MDVILLRSSNFDESQSRFDLVLTVERNKQREGRSSTAMWQEKGGLPVDEIKTTGFAMPGKQSAPFSGSERTGKNKGCVCDWT